MSLHCMYMCATAHLVGRQQKFMKSSTALSTALLLAAGLPAPVLAQTAAKPQPAAQEAVEEVVVTGTRIVREGYEAPTPLSVIDSSALENRSDTNLAVLVTQMPAFSGAGGIASNTSSFSSATPGLNLLNLRNLGANRTLVLLDGNRAVAASNTGQGVDIASFPSQLVSRVDIVTGGASAVYGSDAVAGVVNFVLDKTFTGVKADVSAGMTNHSDKRSWAAQLSAGFGFANDRGHVLLSGEATYDGGTDGDGGRQWNRVGYQGISNPLYGTAAGLSTSVPQTLMRTHVGRNDETPGGIIVSGPLKGIAFGLGGVPFVLNQGTLQSGTQFIGGDWAYTDVRDRYTLGPKQERQSVFARIAYDVTDNFNVYLQSFWTDAREAAYSGPPYTSTAATQAVIKLDNAFLPASVKASMVAKGLTQIQVGSWNTDMGFDYNRANRITTQSIVGASGDFDAFGSNWTWDASGSYGASVMSFHYYNLIQLSHYRLATDAVLDPVSNTIVCRIKLTDPTNPCQPWNAMGEQVNNQVAHDYNAGILGFGHAKIEQASFSSSLTGEPFSVPAGPVSLALSVEHRIDTVHNTTDEAGAAVDHNVGNLAKLDGKMTVTEGAVETVIPLFNGMSWAESWDLNAAARFTSYSDAGYVTTWKVGTTYTPIDDIKFRFTRSRDIRAPNIFESFLPVSSPGQSPATDPFTGTRPSIRSFNRGNVNLVPEKADETGIGVVLAPRFLPGFTASVDYWDVKVKDNIINLTTQNIIDACYNGTEPALCADITRVNGVITTINTGFRNIAVQDARGLDVEASYRFNASQLLSSWDGDVTLHSNATFYLRNYEDRGFIPPTNHVGENSGSSGPPSWRMTTTATYRLNPITVSLSGRAVSAGVINSEFVECTSGCPVSTTAHQTIDNNHIAGAVYFDTNIQYDFDVSGAQATAYFSAKNIFNRSPVLNVAPNALPYLNLGINGTGLYDSYGIVYRAGLRFKF